MREAVSLVLRDEGFGVPSPHAKESLASAEKFLEWVSDADNVQSVCTFACKLIFDLKGCFHASKSMRICRERMWEKYYKLRSNDKFRCMWEKFLLESIATIATPIFYQYVTDKIMEALIKEHFSLKSGSANNKVVVTLDKLEMSALRYTAGSVIRSLIKKIQKSVHPLKEQVKLCLNDLEEDGGKCILCSIRMYL